MGLLEVHQISPKTESPGHAGNGGKDAPIKGEEHLNTSHNAEKTWGKRGVMGKMGREFSTSETKAGLKTFSREDDLLLKCRKRGGEKGGIIRGGGLARKGATITG